MADEIFEGEDMNIYTLTDEEGREENFALLTSAEIEGKIYFALVPENDIDKEDAEYVILRQDKEDGEDVLVTIDDDDEFDNVADFFDNILLGEIDYDGDQNK